MIVVPELGDVAHALRIAHKVQYASMPQGSLGDVVRDVQELKAQLASLEAEVVAAYDTSAEWRAEGHYSAAAAMRHRCRMFGGEAGGVVKQARALRRMPVTARALELAELTTAHVRRLVRAASRPEFGEAEEMLVGFATSLSFTDFNRTVSYWERVVDENRNDGDDTPDPREVNRSLYLSKTLDGRGRLDGWLDPVGYGDFAEALRRIEREFFDADWALAREEHGDAVTADMVWRTPAQRRCDAAVEMARRAMTAPADGKRPEPLTIVHVDHGTFDAAVRALAGEQGVVYPSDRLCELDDGAVLSPAQMLEQAIIGRVRRIVFESPSVILDFGTSVRLFDGALRQAICARDRTCDHEGCEVPSRHCEIDHTIEHSRGGPTVHHNGRPRCSYHHRNTPRPPPPPPPRAGPR